MEEEKTNYLQETLRILERQKLYPNSSSHREADKFRTLREKMEKEYDLNPRPIEHPEPTLLSGDCTLC